MKTFVTVNQGDLTLYLFNITADELVEKTEVSIFSKDNPEGYQRPLNKVHVNNIVKFIESENNPKITSSFILAADSKSINFNLENQTIIDFDKLRLVDGQHRAEAFRVLKSRNLEKYNLLRDLELPATLILSRNEDVSISRLYEIQAFLDLNSKGKKVPTDLAIRLRDEIRSELGIRTVADAYEHISTRVTLKLNDDKNESYWFKAINTEPLEKSGLISINAFIRSQKNLLKSYLDSREVDIDQLIDDDEDMSLFIEDFYNFICYAWKIIGEIWPEAFHNGVIKANKNYVIQKGMGANSMHLILSNLLSRYNPDDSLCNFRKQLNLSHITANDWLVGGSFNGLSSQAGYKMISEYVLNEIPLDNI